MIAASIDGHQFAEFRENSPPAHQINFGPFFAVFSITDAKHHRTSSILSRFGEFSKCETS